MEARRWRWAGLASVGRAPAGRGREGVSSATTACRGGGDGPRARLPFSDVAVPAPPPTVSLPGGVRLLRLARSPGAAAGSSTRRPLGGGGGGSSPCPSGAPLPSAARLSPSGAGRSPVAASPRTGVPSARLGTRATRRRCPPRCRRRPPPAGGGASARAGAPAARRAPPAARPGRSSGQAGVRAISALPLVASPSPTPAHPPPLGPRGPGPALPFSVAAPAAPLPWPCPLTPRFPLRAPPPRPPWRGGARVAVVGRAGGRPAGCFLLRRGEVVAPGGVPRKRGDPAGPAPGGFWGRGRDRGERGRLAVGRWRGPRRGARRALVRHGPAASGGSRPSLGGVGRGRPGGRIGVGAAAAAAAFGLAPPRPASPVPPHPLSRYLARPGAEV